MVFNLLLAQILVGWPQQVSGGLDLLGIGPVDLAYWLRLAITHKNVVEKKLVANFPFLQLVINFLFINTVIEPQHIF